MVTIYCVDCSGAREVKPQDVFQVKRCVGCQKKHAAHLRNMAAYWKRKERNEHIEALRIIVAGYRATGKIEDWHDYCFLKWGNWNFSEQDMIRSYGYGECQSEAMHGYSEEDRAYDMEHMGYTEKDVQDKLARRGAENLLDNEMDCLGDINAGKDAIGVEMLIKDAFDRYKSKEVK